jgi:DNA-directed RNA polymerase specialized sigma24 family protein
MLGEEGMDRIFRDNMTELYWLAFLLTGDRERSVQAYTGALNSEAPAPVLQKFMGSWARRLLIVAALGTIRRQLRESALGAAPASKGDLAQWGRLASPDLTRLTKQDLEDVLLSMDVFTRCAVVLTILERIPVKEAADLLGVDACTVKSAQARGVAEMTWKLAGAIQPTSRGRCGLGQKTMIAFG